MPRIAIFLFLISSLTAGRAFAAAGDLDVTFGDGGFAIANIPGDALAEAGALQTDGKILVGGRQSSEALPHRYDFTIVRFDTDGSLDTSFGDQGIVRIDFDPRGGLLYALAVQSDGKIVAGGDTWGAAIARLLPDGSLDPSFGDGGKIILEEAGPDNFIVALSIEPDASIVALLSDCVAIRVLANGTFDTSFGTDGFAATPWAAPAARCSRSIARTTDGKLLVAGSPSPRSHIDVVRFNQDGSPDLSFGVDGKASSPAGVESYMHNIDIDASGRILVIGRALTPHYLPGVGLVRFLENGTLDTSFADGGVAAPGIADNVLWLQVAADETIVAGGFGSTGPPNYFAKTIVVRFLAGGTLDPTFGNNGWVDVVRGSVFAGMTTLLQPNGRIVVTGYSEEAPHALIPSAFFAARFLASNCGNGVIDGDEECDDGNTLDGDCCSATCTVETPPCVPLGICEGLGDAQISPTASVHRTVLRSGSPASGRFDRWGTGGSFTLLPIQSLEPLTATVTFEIAQNDGNNGLASLYRPSLDPAACSAGACFFPEGTTGSYERRARFRLRGRDADVADAPGLRRALFERRGGASETFRFSMAGAGAVIQSPAPVDSIRRVRQSLRVGDHCVTTVLDCRPIIAGRFLRCGPARCGNGLRDRGEQCGEPGLASCGPGRSCDTCRCVRTN